MARSPSRSVEQITRSACTITLTWTDPIKTFACPGQLLFEEFLCVHHNRQLIASFVSIRSYFLLSHTSPHKIVYFVTISSHSNAS